MEFIKKGVVVKSSTTTSFTKKALDNTGDRKTSSKSSKVSAVKSHTKNRRATIPPPAPMPPRLPTPDLDDLECEIFCDCCVGSSSSSGSKIDKQMAAAKLYISASRSRAVQEPEYERKSPRTLKLEAGKGKY